MSTSRMTAILRPALLALALLVLLTVLLTVQLEPTVHRRVAVDAIAINTIEDLLVDNAPARVGRSGELGLHLDREELNLLVAFILQSIPSMKQWAARVSIASESAILDVSVPLALPRRPLYLNLQAEVLAVNGSAELGTLWIGHLPVPAPAMRALGALGEQWLANSYVNYNVLSQLRDSISGISFEEEAVRIMLNWDPQLLARVQNQAEQLLLSADDSARIQHYSAQLSQVIAALPQDTRSVSLGELMTPLFQVAQANVAQGADPVVENRSLLQALSLHVNEAAFEDAGTTHRVAVTLQRRTDLAQHFTSSAAMTASVGADIASLLATSKEAHDARYRSGFSFSDLTANMAGVALGSAATANAAAARQLQNRLAQATAETDYMPPVSRDLTGLSEDDFLEQFQDRTSSAYLERLNAIDEQLAALPIYSLQ